MSLDEDLAWAPDWSCPACTLLNDATATRCAACDAQCPGANSQVVVVLPREPVKRPADHDASPESWACPACTLLNDALAERCNACNGERWVKRQMTAAALRQRNQVAKKGVTSDAWHERGIWGGLGPDREFLPLPPAPEGRVTYRSAKDNELDMFTELEAPKEEGPKAQDEASKTEAADPKVEGPTPEAPKVEGPTLQDPKSADPKIEDPKVETPNSEDPKPDTKSTEPEVVDSARPQWRVAGAPLFTDASETALEDAVARLAAAGFQQEECLLALEAAAGDETLAVDDTTACC